MENSKLFRSLFIVFTLVGLLASSACTKVDTEAKYPTGYERGGSGTNNIYDQPSSIFGKNGLFGSKSSSEDGAGASGIGVNSFLWRASLDTVSFMPLASADPFGGTILTDWYSAPETPNERYKVNVFILGRQLRSDGVRVRVFKQAKDKKGTWQDVDVPANTGRQLEDSILTRARQLRISQTGQN